MYKKDLNLQVKVRLSDYDYQQLEELSKKRHQQLSTMIRYILRDYILKNK